MENYLHEAFQAFKALDEDVFPATTDGEEALKKFLDGDNLEDIEVIIDPDAETEDELKQSYVGDVIFKCPICQSMIYKKPEDVNIDEDQGLANIEEECPYCQTAGGFEIVGQVSEYCPECEHHDGEAEDKVEEPAAEVDDEVELEESLGRDLTKYQKWVDYDMKRYGKISAKTRVMLRKAGLEVVKDDHDAWTVIAKEKNGKDLKEDTLRDTSVDDQIGNIGYEIDEDKEYDSYILRIDLEYIGPIEMYELPRYGIKLPARLSQSSFKSLDKALEAAKKLFRFLLSKDLRELAGIIIEGIPVGYDEDEEYDNYDDYDTYDLYDPIDYVTFIDESVDSVKVTTEDQEVTVEADGDETEVEIKPRKGEKVDVTSEVIKPVDEETKDDLMADDDVKDYDDNYEDGYEDVSIEDFDEESFDELEEKYLKNIYENVTAYKTIKGSIDGDKIILEGIITFNSGKQKKTTSIFESHSITKRGKIKLLGENKNITTNKKAFTITGSLDGNKLITESLTYNYGVKDEAGKATRLYGTVRK